MNLPTIEMDRTEARQKFLDYRRDVRQRHDDEMEEIMRGYKALASGKQLIQLSEVMSRAGVTAVHTRRYGTIAIPRFAICRADERLCTIELRTDGSATFCGYREEEAMAWGAPHRSNLRRVLVPRGTFEIVTSVSIGNLNAMVPIVPPHLKPKSHLRNFHILWEAEWRERRPAVPRDPALLRRIGGDLFAVVAIWDLTELERAVLAGRSL